MRTTLTLDEDVAQTVKRIARERDISFKQAVNDTLRAGMANGQPKRKPFRTKTYSMGVKPGVDLTKANQLAAQLEDEEILRKLRLGK
jgi:hypothetical protein